MRPSALLLVLVLPFGVACGPEENGPDTTVLGAQIWWGDREHGDAHEYLSACGEFLGRRDFDGMSVFFDGELSYLSLIHI